MELKLCSQLLTAYKPAGARQVPGTQRRKICSPPQWQFSATVTGSTTQRSVHTEEQQSRLPSQRRNSCTLERKAGRTEGHGGRRTVWLVLWVQGQDCVRGHKEGPWRPVEQGLLPEGVQSGVWCGICPVG